MPTLSCSRWMFLLSLAALMLISASAVVAAGGSFQELDCWKVCIFPKKLGIQTCFEQRPRHDCSTHGYVVKTEKGRTICIKGDAHWLQKRISDGHLHCPPDISGPL